MKRLLPTTFIFFVCSVLSAATVSVTDNTNTFTQVTRNGVSMTDFTNDEYGSGNNEYDFTTNGFYLKYGSLFSGGPLVQLVRFRFDAFDNSGFDGRVKVGLDVDQDGRVDIYYGVNDTGANQGIGFQNPTNVGSNYNYSPATSALGARYGVVSLNSTNYSYVRTGNDAFLTFVMPYQSLETALTNLGFNVTEETQMRYIAFTSSNNGSINQDLYGTNTIVGTANFTDGAFTDYQDFRGKGPPIPIVPEPEMYGVIFVSLMVGIVGYIKKQKK